MANNSLIRVWWVLTIVVLLSAGAARAQDAPAPPPPTQGPPNADPGAASGQMAAQIGGMIGGAEFMLILDKPYEAEALFGAILQMDPNNAYAKQGLERVQFAKRPNWTFLIHPFKFTIDQEMITYGGGPSFYRKNLKSTFWIGDGFFKNDIKASNPFVGALEPFLGTADDEALRKQTYNAILEPYYKQFDGYVFLNRTVYQKAPNRTLYFLKGTWNRQPGRESYSAFGGVHDSYYQNELSQFFAPESWTAVQQLLVSHEIGVSATYPLGRFIDLSGGFSYFNYNDEGSLENPTGNGKGNTRRLARYGAMYRVMPSAGKQMPILRFGVTGLYDDGDYLSFKYFIPLSYKYVAISGDYTYISGKTKFGFYGNWPINKKSGEGFGGQPFNTQRTMYTFLNRKVSPSNELWLKLAVMYTRDAGPRFGDLVVGFNTRF
jgi:hypothetical protein